MTETTMPEFDTVEDLVADATQNAGYHTILEVWSKVLEPIATERDKRVTPQWANRIVGGYQEVTYADMLTYRERYFDLLEDLQSILLEEIASDEECLKKADAVEDREENAEHYLNVLITWQKVILQWELDWDCTGSDAAVMLAAISEVHKMLFNETGLTSLLDNIQFEFTEADQDLLAGELNALRDAVQEG